MTARNARFAGSFADWFAAQRYNHLRQRWPESYATGEQALRRDGAQAQAQECRVMLCEAALAMGDSDFATDALAAHLPRVEGAAVEALLRRFLEACTPDQARHVLASVKCSPLQYREIAYRLFGERRFDLAEAVGDCWEADFPGGGFDPPNAFLPWVYWRQLRYEAAVAAFDAAYARHGNTELLGGKATVLSFMGRFAESVACYRELERIRPLTDDECKPMAMSLFGAGQVRESMMRHEDRLRGPAFTTAVPPGLPRWDGRPLKGKLLVMWDPGWAWGDYLMYARYLPLLQERVGPIVVQASAAVHPDAILDPVVRSACPGAQLGSAQDRGDCEAYVWLMSLPVVLGLYSTAPDTLPWLATDAPRAASWQRWWAAQDDGASPRRRRIGLCWRGNPSTYHDRYRSLSFEDLMPLLKGLGDVDWVNLQWAATEKPPAEWLQARNSRWLDPMPQVSGLLDTAAVARTLDDVVSIDSTVAHLCGSAGVRLTLLVPIYGEWRWQEGDRSPWYPAAKLVRTAVGSTPRATVHRLADQGLDWEAAR